jgi:hypothetical protein
MNLEVLGSHRSEKLVILADGFVDLAPLAGVLNEKVEGMSEGKFIEWVDGWAANEVSGDPEFDIAVFERGEEGDLFTCDLGKRGIIKEQLIPVIQGEPYVVRVEDAVGGELSLSVERKAGFGDFEKAHRWLKKNRGQSQVSQLIFVKRANTGLIDKWGRVVFLTRATKKKPKPREVWIGRVEGRRKIVIFTPYSRAEEWVRYLPGMMNSVPVIRRDLFHGLEYIESPVPIRVDSLETLENLPSGLSDVQLAIIAKLWNIYWGGQRERRKLIEGILDKLRD